MAIDNRTSNRDYPKPNVSNLLSEDVVRLAEALDDIDTDVAAAQSSLDTKAPVASPTFTGTPAAPTPAVDTDTTQLATTAFVMGQTSTDEPVMAGTAAAGSSSRFARADHRHPIDTSRASVASPTFTGTPAAPTPAVDTNTAQLATTAFVVGQDYTKQTRQLFAGTGLTGGGDLSANRTFAADVATQAEAEAGTSAAKLMTPQRTAQAIVASGALAGMRNRIINGGMQIAQRGAVSFGNNTGTYGGCDRWIAGLFNFTTATGTVTKVGGVNAVNEIQATTTGTNASQVIVFGQRIEAANVFDLSGKTITMSATLYHDAGFAITPIFDFYKPNALDNYSAATYVTGIALDPLPSLSRVRYSFTTTLGATDADNGLAAQIVFPINAPITSKYFQISEVQLELGPVATPFERRPYGQELALCQRYYYQPGNPDYFFGTGTRVYGAGGNTDATYGSSAFPVTMRAAPTSNYTASAEVNIDAGSATIQTAADCAKLYVNPSGNGVNMLLTLSALSFNAEL